MPNFKEIKFIEPGQNQQNFVKTFFNITFVDRLANEDE
jgi:hypothetical protein